MKYAYLIFALWLMPLIFYGQGKSNLEQLQGFWKQNVESDDVKLYEYYEGHSLYTISSKNGEISVRKFYVAFSDESRDDSLTLKDLKGNGDWYGFINPIFLKGNPTKIRNSYFKSFAYDLGEDYFNYYGSKPFSLTKVTALPADIYPDFLKKKEELDRKIIFDFIPSYKRSGANKLPNTIEATNEKVYFHTLPDNSTQRKAFIVKGQKAKVLDHKDGWYFILFEGETSRETGWVKESEVK